jgi:endoglucanase
MARSIGCVVVLALAGCGSSSSDDDDSVGQTGAGGSVAGSAGQVTSSGGALGQGGGNTTGGTGGSGADAGSGATAAAAGTGAMSGGSSGGTSGQGGGNTTGGTGAFGGLSSTAPDVSPFIVVDQFGYLPDMEKLAVLRDPQTGADADQSFAAGSHYALVDATSGAQVYAAAPAPWSAGKEDPSSGDKASWFDFSSVTTPGSYYVLDIDNDVRSYAFEIADNVYAGVLEQALRMFFYQRAGQEKKAEHAGAGWVDAASHVGPLQDHNARVYNDKNNAATERDLWGGWYDAGDFNKYTNWTAGYVENLLRAFAENPPAFGDASKIPESGNGIPDVLDEAKWGLDFLMRMQDDDGSVLSIVGESGASPPSSATGPSLYGTPNTSATLATAAAFAYGAQVLAPQSTELAAYAAELGMRAAKAYDWAEQNPSVVFKNNDSASGSSGLGSGQQETDDYGRTAYKLDAAIQLFRLTGDAKYQTFVDANYRTSHLVAYGNYVSEWDVALQDALLEYARAEGATADVAEAISANYEMGVAAAGNMGQLANPDDPYLAYLKDYTWGSNQTKAAKGNLFTAAVTHGVHPEYDADYLRAAARYIHYLHGVNPLSLVYVSNMNEHGAENSVNEFYHTWFTDKSPLWDRVGVSTYGPPPGYLVGGPNPSYDVDGCCPSGCGSSENNALCTSMSLSPPKGQPPQKSYKDFNAEWPLDSWSISEPSDGYQIGYIRLLSKFVK